MIQTQLPTNVPHLQPFTLGDWLVEPKPCQVSRGDTVIKLRPQLVDVLVCLARHAGKIVLKDELLKEVWPGQYIAESGLSRCVAELRQILQDDAQQPRYIETVMKRGYRLVAPVVWLPPQDDVAPDVGHSAAQASTPIPDAGQAAPEAGAPTEPATPVPLAAAAGHKRWIPSRPAIWSAIAVLLIVAGITAVVFVTRTPARILSERDTVLLADIRNGTGDPIFDDTLRLALAVNLEQAPFLHILPQDVVRAAVVRTGRTPDERVVGPLALDVCRREGAAVLLAGSIALLGSRYAIGIEAIACESGDAIARALVEADRKDRVLQALEQAATRIRQKLGESHDSLRQHAVPLERATTPSLDALKALTLGDYNRDHARLAGALMLYRQATDLDPGFALAWARLGAVARNLGRGEETVPALRRAFALRDRVSQPERFYIEAHYRGMVEGNPDKAIEIYQAWKRMYPGSVIPPTNLSGLLSGMLGRYDEALAEAREAVRLAPGSSIAHRTVVRAHLGAGRIPEARRAIADAVNRGADDALTHRLLLNMALLDGDGAALQRETDWASREPMTALDASRRRASAVMSAGRLREARQLWSQAHAMASAIGPPRRVAETLLYQAEAEALVGDRQVARRSAEAAVAADPNPVTQATAAIVFALAGERARAGAILDDIARQPLSDPGPLIVSLPCARALVEAADGHGANALEIMQRISRFARGSDYALVPLGVSALIDLRGGRPANAAAAFRDLIQLRAIEPSSPWVAFARLELARALREAGDVAGSVAAYDAFLESWKHADPDVALLAVARRERAAVAPR
jgi:eukaryotic-like serine/threonine-protein kinase